MEIREPERQPLTLTHWLILLVAVIGFAFDIYELLMMPLIARPALAQLLSVDPLTESGHQLILTWTGRIQWGSALCGGTFGLLGGYLTDRFGRRRVLTWSILLYACSAFAAGFATSAAMLLVLRCATFVGVCVEFVAAVAWLAEVFPNPRQREWVLGVTQAFSSLGGLLVAGVYYLVIHYADQLPAIYGTHEPWRYTLISGLIPALPLIVIRPFLPESPVWCEKKRAGTLKRPSLAELFAPKFRRTTIASTILFACAYGAAFGAIQFTPQIVPGLVAGAPKLKELRKELEAAKEAGSDTSALRAEIGKVAGAQQKAVSRVQSWQEIGGLLGRCALAVLAMYIVSRRALLRVFQVPGLIVIPLIFVFWATKDVELLKWGIALAGFFTVAQFSFWGNYLPVVYPAYLRGTGEGFAANVGGRMIGTSAAVLTPAIANLFSSGTPFQRLAYAAATTAAIVYTLGFITSFWLPEPAQEDSHD
ncbi:MAG: MFS transporter [Pirellulales bacterium]|nr:MFS transporter [Pirellulales bacterium]